MNGGDIQHERSREYASRIMEAMVTNNPYKIGGNVLNTGLIDNLPSDACVEVPCMVDGNGIHPTHVGKLPVQCAAMNILNINCQLLTIEAAVTGTSIRRQCSIRTRERSCPSTISLLCATSLSKRTPKPAIPYFKSDYVEFMLI